MSLTIKDVNKSFSTPTGRLEILKGLSLEVKDGEAIAILGPSGSGKSTFLSLMAGLDRPEAGAIVIGNVDITKLNENQITQFRGSKLGIVFQQFHLMPHLTALENVMLPLEINGKVSDANFAEELLVSVGLKGRMDHLPSQLSGGECQRVAIARALVVRPSLLLADEPTGNLDANTGKGVIDLLFSMLKKYKITSLVVTHSKEVAERCDASYLLKDGRLEKN